MMQIAMALLAGVGFIISLVAAVVVIHSNPRERLNQFFFSFALAIAALNLLEFLMKIANDAGRAQFYFYLHFAAWMIFIALLTHFTLVLARREKILSNIPIYFLLYAPAPVFVYLNTTTNWFYYGVALEPWGFTQQFAAFYWVVALYSILFFLGIIYLGWQAWREEQNSRAKKQKAIIFYSFVSTFILAFIFEVILRSLGWHFPPTITLMPTIIVAFFAYAMLRYGLLVVTPAYLARDILNIMPDLMVFVDDLGRVQAVNEGFSKNLGFANHELIGTPFEAICLGRNECQAIVTAIQEQATIKNRSAYLKRKDGSSFPVNYSAARVKDPFGEVAGKVIVFHDVTDQEKLLTDQTRMIEELSKTKKQMESLLKEAADARDKARLASEELVLKVRELEEFHNVAVGRELKMIEREKEVNELLKELGRGPKYK